MASRRASDDPESTPRRRRPATTPEGRENQLVSMAADLAERRIREGTASAQEIVHFLRLGSSRERLEQERLRRENLLLEAKAEAIASSSRYEELVKDAMKAFKSYSGQAPEEDDYEV